VSLQAEIDQLEAQALDLAGALERVAGIAPAASTLIERELAGVRARMAGLAAEQAASSAQADEMERDALRAALLAMVEALPRVPAMPYDDLARLIQRNVRGLYVKNGQLAPAPVRG
jgi:hypothetical protein